MPESMIERIARALCEKRMTPPIYPQEIDADWPMFAEEARAVLAAMREPTVVMIDAMYDEYQGGRKGSLRDAFREAIDAALAEQL